MFRPCAVIPTYDNPLTVRATVERVRSNLPDVIVVDDGSGERARLAVEELAKDKLAIVVHRPRNGGKGAAVKAGFEIASRMAFSHAVQIDADGQHDLDDVPRFLEAARKRPEALILGRPVFDDSQPWGRSFGRKISQFWVNLETAGGAISDPQCGFRVYPLEAAMAARPRANRMDFDQEIAVRMCWRGVLVVNIPTRVRYLPREEGGVSHFLMVRDNLRISIMHTRLVLQAPWALARRAVEKRRS